MSILTTNIRKEQRLLLKLLTPLVCVVSHQPLLSAGTAGEFVLTCDNNTWMLVAVPKRKEGVTEDVVHLLRSIPFQLKSF